MDSPISRNTFYSKTSKLVLGSEDNLLERYICIVSIKYPSVAKTAGQSQYGNTYVIFLDYILYCTCAARYAYIMCVQNNIMCRNQ